MSLLIALCLAGALFQSPAAAQGAAVSGRVVEDGSRMPIAGAQVTLLPSRPGPSPISFHERFRTTTTDRDGLYSFTGIAPGRYQITVQKAGFAGFAPLDQRQSLEVDLEPGARRDDMNVTMQKGAVIVGRVLDEAGEPLVNAHVMPMRKPGPNSAFGLSGGANGAFVASGGPNVAFGAPGILFPGGPGGQTNDLGEFRLFSLPPGEYYVQAAANFGGPTAPRGRTMLPTYFPDTSDPAAAQPITVGAGQTSSEVVIRMIGAPTFQVSGVVLDDAGRPVANAIVRLMQDEPTRPFPVMMGPQGEARTDASGAFRLDTVTTGTYTLLAIAPMVTSGRAASRGAGPAGAGGSSAIAFGGIGSGSVGGGVRTETSSDGVTTVYRDDMGTRVPISVHQANVSGLEVVVRRPVSRR